MNIKLTSKQLEELIIIVIVFYHVGWSNIRQLKDLIWGVKHVMLDEISITLHHCSQVDFLKLTNLKSKHVNRMNSVIKVIP